MEHVHSLSPSERVALLSDPRYFLHFFAYYYEEFLAFPFARFHGDFAQDIIDMLQSRITRCVWCTAGETAKSSIAKAFLVYCIAYKYTLYPNVDAHDRDNSVRFIYEAIHTFQTNQRFRNDFGDLFTATSSRSEEKTEKKIDNFITTTGVRVEAHTTQESMRGRVHGPHRPDGIFCHEIGTVIRDGGLQMRVEEHPSFRNTVELDGVEVSLFGLPFSERVTQQHLYLARDVQYAGEKRKGGTVVIGEEKWVEAGSLSRSKGRCDYIGMPIDMGVCVPPPVTVRKRKIVERNARGQTKGTEFYDTLEKFDWFEDEDFWWLVGVWWGDGHLAQEQVWFTVADKDVHIHDRLVSVIRKMGRSPIFIERESKCHNIGFSYRVLARWLKTWKFGNAIKIPPAWVEKLPVPLQIQLIRGYLDSDGWVDNKNGQVRLTSVNLEGLLSVRRMLARIGVCSSIRHGMKPHYAVFPNGQVCFSRKKFDLRFNRGAEKLGYELRQVDNRRSVDNAFILDGKMWVKVKSVEECGTIQACPIKTESGTYLTAFGLSHNCDDFETLSTVRSPAATLEVSQHISEMKRGLAQSRSFQLYLCNYLSETGNVAALEADAKLDPMMRFRKIPRVYDDGTPSWPERDVLTDKELLLPENKGKISIETKMRAMRRADTGDADWMREMQLRPVDPLGEGPDKGGYSALLPLSLLEPAIVPVAPYPSPPSSVIMGVDPAGDGADATAIVIRTPFFAFVHAELHKKDENEVADVVIAAATKYGINPRNIVVDAFGIGYKLVKVLSLKGFDIRAVNVGEQVFSSKERDKCLNDRAYGYKRLRDWLSSGGRLQAHPQWKVEAKAVRYLIDENNLMRIIPKKEMLRRGHRSPNCADGLMLTHLFDPQGDKRQRSPSPRSAPFDPYSPCP